MPNALSDVERQIADLIKNKSLTTNSQIFDLYNNQYKPAIKSQYGSLFDTLKNTNFNSLYGQNAASSIDLGSGYSVKKGQMYYTDNGDTSWDTFDLYGPDGQLIGNTVNRGSGSLRSGLVDTLQNALGVGGIFHNTGGSSNDINQFLSRLNASAGTGVNNLNELNAMLAGRLAEQPQTNLGTFVNAAGKEVVATSPEMLKNFQTFGFKQVGSADTSQQNNSSTDQTGTPISMSMTGGEQAQQEVANNQPPAGATYISNPADLAGLTEQQIWREPGTGRIFKLGQGGNTGNASTQSGGQQFGEYISNPADLANYSESEIVRGPDGKIYTKPGVPLKTSSGGFNDQTGGSDNQDVQEDPYITAIKDMYKQFGMEMPGTLTDPVSQAYSWYNTLYTQMGLPTVKNQMDDINKQITAQANERDDAIAEVNDDPWLTEGVRLRRNQKISDKYDNKIKNLTNQFNLYESVYSRGTQEAQFMMGKALELNQNKQQMSQDLVFKAIDMAQKAADAGKGNVDWGVVGQHYDENTGTMVNDYGFIDKTNMTISGASGNSGDLFGTSGVGSQDYNAGSARSSDRLSLVTQLGTMVYGSRISDNETKLINKIINAKIKEEPDISTTDLRLSLMKSLLGFDVQNNKELADGLMQTVLQSSGTDGLKGFDMAGLAQLLNADNVSGAITKVENFALLKQKQLDPQNYFGEAGANTTVNFAEELAKKISDLGTLGKSPLGNFNGTIQQWLGKFKSGEAQTVAADIVNMMANWRLRFAGSAVTPTEMQFLSDSMPSLTDRTTQMAAKLSSLKSAALLQYNATRANVNLPELDFNSLKNKAARADLYNFGGGSSSGQTGSIISPEYLSWLQGESTRLRTSLMPEKESNLLKYYKQQNPGVEDSVLLQAIRESMQSSFNSVGGDTKSATLSKVSAIPSGVKAGQCGRFINKLTGIGLGDSYQSKIAKMDPKIKQPKAGMVFVMPYKNTGHTGIILAIKNGIATVKDSNWSLDEKVKIHQIPIAKMTGFRMVG